MESEAPMSGGGGDTPYGGPRGGPPDCRIVERVILNSPNPRVLANLKLGDELTVKVVGASLVAEPSVGPPAAGALTPARLGDLIDCIAKGNVYKAVVVALAGGRCDVEIRPA
jgi:hypothetical protein